MVDVSAHACRKVSESAEGEGDGSVGLMDNVGPVGFGVWVERGNNFESIGDLLAGEG